MEGSNVFRGLLVVFSLVLLSCVHGALGVISCENLDKTNCAFAVSSTGKRCVLEKHFRRGGMQVKTCRESEIGAEGLKDWVESDGCIKACGLERETFGVSSDLLLEPSFVQKLCSSGCYHNCPNIVGLYFNLAAGEGTFLPNLCRPEKSARRAMSEMRSYGEAAGGPVAAPGHASTPVIHLLELNSAAQPPVMA